MNEQTQGLRNRVCVAHSWIYTQIVLNSAGNKTFCNKCMAPHTCKSCIAKSTNKKTHTSQHKLYKAKITYIDVSSGVIALAKIQEPTHEFYQAVAM